MPVRDLNWCTVPGVRPPPPDTVRYWENPRFPSLHLTHRECSDMLKRAAPLSGPMPRHLIPALDRPPPKAVAKARPTTHWREED